ncbi:MAG: hypothetical protein NZ561_05220 [Phycisphaerae bacterium]|nr:hypothetical protein [Phycisphaerae bacterium]MDW8261899.1 hypothetical protein [Phycisphaerales bacterium]
MDAPDLHPPAAERRPGTLSVLFLLATAALVFSYLGAYCLTDALVAAGLRSPLPRDPDPRPRWLLTGWLTLTAAFSIFGWIWKLLISRQLRSIDEMESADEAPE